MGFRRLHVVDLDGATGRGENGQLVERIISTVPAKVQVGGGIRRAERVDELLALGATEVVVGTRAIQGADWLEQVASRHPGRVILAADVRRRNVLTKGWTQAESVDIRALVSTLSSVPLAGILVTAVHVEGMMTGPDLALIEEVSTISAHPVIASGGIASLTDLRALARCGAASAVIGMALYTGVLDATTVAEEFST
jgi:phosphoribosylformimino-5-aminoimidazole carboxamide ribotide isomerase